MRHLLILLRRKHVLKSYARAVAEILDGMNHHICKSCCEEFSLVANEVVNL